VSLLTSFFIIVAIRDVQPHLTVSYAPMTIIAKGARHIMRSLTDNASSVVKLCLTVKNAPT
jgi:hypothetical protein